MKIIYSILITLSLPFLFLRLLIKSYRSPLYRRRFLERLGFFKNKYKNSIWIHAVSVGESVVAVKLITELQKMYPNDNITVTSTTPTGSNTIRNRFKNIQNIYLPFDVPFLMNFFIKRLQPKIAIIVETEIWPNLISTCEKLNIPTILINARLSEKSFLGYKRFGKLSKNLINKFTHIVAQHEDDANRFKKLGINNKQISVSGNIKFDITGSAEQKEIGKRFKEKYPNRQIWIAASTHEGEEKIILDAHKKILKNIPDALLLIVPRHPERFDLVAKYIEDYNFTYDRKSNLKEILHPDVILCDTMGELNTLYHASNAAFIGGSLVNIGGHNMLEAAISGIPITTGIYLHNFTYISQLLFNENAMVQVRNADELSNQITIWLKDESISQNYGKRALCVVTDNQGATLKTLKILQNII